MADLVHDAQNEFWRPPAAQSGAEPVLADACRRCGTEFMVGAAFCHICGTNRHRAGASAGMSWSRCVALFRAIDLGAVQNWLGLPLPSLCAFLIGVACLIVALAVGLTSVHDYTDFEAVQLWRIQWLMAGCAAFLAGILLKNRKPEN